MKKFSHDETVPTDKQQYKKKFLVRKLVEKDAEKEIYDFVYSDSPDDYREEIPKMPNT